MGWVTVDRWVPYGEWGDWQDDPPLVLFAPQRDIPFFWDEVRLRDPDYPVTMFPLLSRINGMRIRGFEVHLLGEPYTDRIRRWIDEALKPQVVPAMWGFHVNDIVRGKF